MEELKTAILKNMYQQRISCGLIAVGLLLLTAGFVGLLYDSFTTGLPNTKTNEKFSSTNTVVANVERNITTERNITSVESFVQAVSTPSLQMSNEETSMTEPKEEHDELVGFHATRCDLIECGDSIKSNESNESSDSVDSDTPQLLTVEQWAQKFDCKFSEFTRKLFVCFFLNFCN